MTYCTVYTKCLVKRLSAAAVEILTQTTHIHGKSDDAISLIYVHLCGNRKYASDAAVLIWKHESSFVQRTQPNCSVC